MSNTELFLTKLKQLAEQIFAKASEKFATKADASVKVNRSGDAMTGSLSAPSLSTGTDSKNYISSRKLRGSGDASSYSHAIDYGYEGHNQMDVYEVGGTFNFYKSSDGTKSNSSLIGSIQDGNGWVGKVNGHSINSDVPENAKFTDTVPDYGLSVVDGILCCKYEED